MGITMNNAGTVPVLLIGDGSVAAGIFSHFVSSLARALERAGESVIVYGRDCHTPDDLLNIIESPLKCIIGFQEKFLCCDPVVEKHIKCFQFIFDNPFELTGIILKRNDPEYITLFSDSGYMKDAVRFFGQKNAYFFPPGAAIDNMCTVPAAVREMDVVFFGAYRRAPGDDYRWEDEFYRCFYEYMLKHPSKTFREGAEELLAMTGEHFEEDEFVAIMQLLKHSCNLAAGAYRAGVVECLLENGIMIHVFGNSWDMYNGKYPERLIRHSGVNAVSAAGVYQNSKISLNVMSWHRAGITERILESMICGAVCVSDETTELKNEFVNRSDILMFMPEQPQAVVNSIKYLLSEPDILNMIAVSGRDKVVTGHTWDLRVKKIMSMLEM